MAGIIGILAAAFYLAVIVGQTDAVEPVAIFWLVVMATAALLAWSADELQGRRAAIAAAVLFFILGSRSPILFAVVFLVAVSLCVIGFVEWPR